MGEKQIKKRTFYSVALLIIVLGSAIFAYGMVGWIYNYWNAVNLVAFPSLKIIAGLALISLGYIQLELELIRKDQ